MREKVRSKTEDLSASADLIPVQDGHPSSRDDPMRTQDQTANTMLADQFRQLRSELGKDALFFGFTGVLIGLLHLSESRILGVNVAGARLSDDLVGDYISIAALGFQLLLCMLLGGVIGLMTFARSLQSVALGLYDHARMRLLQLASPMICFSLGLGITSSAHYFWTGGGRGLALAGMLVFLVFFVVVAYLLQAIFDPRIDWPGARRKPWAFPLVTVGLSLAGMLFLIHAIPAQHRQEDVAAATHACDQVSRPDRR